MKVLLGENMPHQLRAQLPDFDVSTAVYAGFGFKNGELSNYNLSRSGGAPHHLCNPLKRHFLATP